MRQQSLCMSEPNIGDSLVPAPRRVRFPNQMMTITIVLFPSSLSSIGCPCGSNIGSHGWGPKAMLQFRSNMLVFSLHLFS